MAPERSGDPVKKRIGGSVFTSAASSGDSRRGSGVGRRGGRSARNPRSAMRPGPPFRDDRPRFTIRATCRPSANPFATHVSSLRDESNVPTDLPSTNASKNPSGEVWSRKVSPQIQRHAPFRWHTVKDVPSNSTSTASPAFSLTNLSVGGEICDVLYAVNDAGMITDEAYSGLVIGDDRHNHSEIQNAIDAYARVVCKKSNGRILYETYPKVLNSILDAYLGEVPEEFEYDGVKYTPKSFAEKYALDINEYVQFSSFMDQEMYQPFLMLIPDNWTYTMTYNMGFDEMMAELDNALNNGYTVGWAQDVSDKGFSRKDGLAIVPEDDVNKIRESNPKAFKKMTDEEVMEKQYSFEYIMPEKEVTAEMHQRAYDDWSTGDDHSMLIVGIAHDQKGNKYYKVKNSWGESGPYKGYWYCSEEFVKLHTVFFTVNKAALSDEMRNNLGIE